MQGLLLLNKGVLTDQEFINALYVTPDSEGSRQKYLGMNLSIAVGPTHDRERCNVRHPTIGIYHGWNITRGDKESYKPLNKVTIV